jgi:hypothetical protein
LTETSGLLLAALLFSASTSDTFSASRPGDMLRPQKWGQLLSRLGRIGLSFFFFRLPRPLPRRPSQRPASDDHRLSSEIRAN